jgi:hypothetical protein
VTPSAPIKAAVVAASFFSVCFSSGFSLSSRSRFILLIVVRSAVDISLPDRVVPSAARACGNVLEKLVLSAPSGFVRVGEAARMISFLGDPVSC